MMRTCCRCKKPKPLDAFSQSLREPLGREYRCKECRRIGVAGHVESLPGETWVPVSGYTDAYAVSDMGRLKSLRRTRLSMGRTVSVPERLVSGRPTSSGHVRALLSNPKRNVFIHRLVLEAFVGPCPDGMQACHGNGTPTDNRAANLRWGTIRDNVNDKIAHGRSGARFTAEERETIARQRASGVSIRTLAKQYNVCDAAIVRAHRMGLAAETCQEAPNV